MSADRYERILSVDDHGIVAETPWWVDAETDDEDEDE